MRPFGKKRIEVQFDDGHTDAINPALLNTYIETGKITRFKRSDGWVRVGVDPIRGQNGRYGGKDRRKH